MNPNKNIFDETLITSGFTIPGYKITKNLGIVRGITVRSRSVVGNIGASFQALFGGNITILTELCEKARHEAYEIMLNHAQSLGGNAVIAMSYDATELMQGITEVLCYGTAVIVEKE